MANTLMCTERMDSRHAEHDPVVFADQRVLDNLLISESFSMINIDYFAAVQHDITGHMRRIVVNWMMEVCEELSCENQVFPLAVRIMDHYLSRCSLKRQNFQLLGAVCLNVASKFRQVQAISTERLIYYTDNSVTSQDMLRVELMLLLQLNWNLSLVTASDFVEHVLSRVPWSKESPLLRRHAHLLLQLCCADHEIIQVRPSAVASGCLIAAARGLRIPSFSKVTQHVCALTQVHEDDARAIEQRVEALVREEEARHAVVQPRAPVTSQPLKPNSTGMPGNGSIPLDILIDDDVMDQSSQPETPTDVQDVHF